ncbi:hypothetical protein, partial [Thiolapillus sp.]|uniref:hypothetical protein n=1 Tax=Thiolapillus sp. TaxID=2017437 RepID=UPI0025ED2535
MDGDEPAGDRATSHDSVHDVLVNKKSNAMLVSVLFSTEENLVSFLCCCFALFNIFLERIMTDALEDHEGTVSIGGRTIINLRFADDIDGLAGEEEELANLVE